MNRRRVIILGVIVTLKLVLHALYLPVFEGPDEPFHLGLAQAVAAGDFISPDNKRYLQPDVAAAVRGNPCAPDLRRMFGCEPFRGTGGFNIVRGARHRPQTGLLPTDEVENYESHQPPVYYLVSGAVLLTARPLGTEDPIRAILVLRLLSVTMVGFGFWLIVKCDTPIAAAIIGLALLTPGASESLARTANDAAIFMVCCIVIYAYRRSRFGLLVVSLGVAPLIKLTAAPLVAAMIVRLWFDGRRRTALLAGVAGLTVAPVQMLRGWAWGGTVELNQASIGLSDSLTDTAIGLARSTYTISKTTIWLGNWSFFREPVVLVALTFAFLAILLLGSRYRRGTATYSLAAGLVVLFAGVIVFSLAHRSLFGQWGGVGGWYLWGLIPWIVCWGVEAGQLRPQLRIPLVTSAILLLATLNGFWLFAASNLYGPCFSC